MRLSDHFTLEELTRSSIAARLGLSNAPTDAHLANLHELAKGLEAARRLLGDRPLTITSGYRSVAVNRAVGGVRNSDHALGWAADLHVEGMSDLAAAGALCGSDLSFDQLILEPGRCVHLSFHPRLRGQRLTQRRLGGRCEIGIHP